MSCSFVSFYFNDENQNFDILVPLEWFETREFFVEILKSSFGDLFLELTNSSGAASFASILRTLRAH